MSIRVSELSAIIQSHVDNFAATPTVSEAGTVQRTGDGIAQVMGLNQVMSGELLDFPGGMQGIALNLEKESVGVILLGQNSTIREGDPVRRTGTVIEIPVGDALLGRVVNALGQPLDHQGALATTKTRRIESVAPGVMARKEVAVPLQTGIKAIDILVPIGRGQRELIIGDRQTGKTAICIDTIINQKGTGVHCIYVAIGQKAATVARIIRTLKENGAMEYSTVVAATAGDATSLQYIAPYAGCAIGEEWMEQGKDVLIIYDDLSKHAVAYRTISLLLRRPPGREAYPGDIFYLHSRLLERAACLSDEMGGGTLTALPVVETLEGDISAYIPTNLISITDGQIFLEAELFNEGIRPAINPGFSISRVGGAAQVRAMRQLAGPLRIELAQYRELAAFAQYGSDLSRDTLMRLRQGERIVELLKQEQYAPLPVEQQVLMVFALVHGFLAEVHVDQIQEFERDFLEYMDRDQSWLLAEIREKKEFSPELVEQFKKILDAFLKTHIYH
ncbi:MAG: F0F1 ATP synthase subunit alpha [Symbiobacteriaceae bacterium]|nr:F0F1 ATP synthase subunit alpha [Symbiobacteriaceae bacterium]